jgi:hypothetical protein
VFANSAEQKAVAKQDPRVEHTTDTRHRGRGGAGNFAWNSEADDTAKKEQEEREQHIKESILKDVESGLAMPGKAVLKPEGLTDVN